MSSNNNETIQIRSPLARMLYSKLQHQKEHSTNKHMEWYSIRREYLPSNFQNQFLQFHQDEQTDQFLESCYNKSDWIFTQIYHSLAKSFLTWFMSSTSANGLLARGSMFVYSTEQFRRLLNISEDVVMDALLDLGAGDGQVTNKMSGHFRQVFVTEMSPVMRWRLQQNNFHVLDIDKWNHIDGIPKNIWIEKRGSLPQYDVVACLNLLDRCDKPLTLLEEIKQVLRPVTGRLIVALVLPLKQYVEVNEDHRPTEIMDVSGSHIWEIQFTSVIENVFIPAGYELESWSVVPYLCEGDFSRSFYSLNDILMVFKAQMPINKAE